MLFDRPVACIDVETTGASPQFDRITEIGIIELAEDGSVSEWSTLVNPQVLIPEFIEKLTGISNAMVETAPTFEEIAQELLQRLNGRVFVAHNARFDYAFIRNELKRIDIAFRADTLCTVRLSRRLYPQHYKHNLDSLIQRLGISMEVRHRALADARVLVSFLQRLPQEHTPEVIANAIRHVMAKPALPPHLSEGLIDDIPDSPGVYLFYGDSDLPLYVGKSTSIRTRVLSHFSGDHASTKELRISQQLKRIDWYETAGELGALLLEARLVKQLQPIHNQRLRRENDLCAWQIVGGPNGGKTVQLQYAADIDFGSTPNLYGMFTSQRKAIETMRGLADAHKLCLVQLGLEKPARGKHYPCFGHQLKKCQGLCAGKENPLQHDLRLLQALSRLKLQSWPYASAIGIRESYLGREELHIVDHWAYLGTARNEAEIAPILDGSSATTFDLDTYKILAKYLQTHCDVVPLARENEANGAA
jgi:DNA polymerase-3 subunit epsilon